MKQPGILTGACKKQQKIQNIFQNQTHFGPTPEKKKKKNQPLARLRMMHSIYAGNKVELGPPNLLEGSMKNEKRPSTATEENFLSFSPSHEKNQEGG